MENIETKDYTKIMEDMCYYKEMNAIQKLGKESTLQIYAQLEAQKEESNNYVL